MSGRRLLAAKKSLDDWVRDWSASTAASWWCEKFLDESGTEGLLEYHSKHAVFGMESPSVGVRLHHGPNHYGGEKHRDGRVLPELQIWQMNVHVEMIGNA